MRQTHKTIRWGLAAQIKAVNSTSLEKKHWNANPNHGEQDYSRFCAGKQTSQICAHREVKRVQKGTLCVGQQLHVVCAAHLQLSVLQGMHR